MTRTSFPTPFLLHQRQYCPGIRDACTSVNTEYLYDRLAMLSPGCLTLHSDLTSTCRTKRFHHQSKTRDVQPSTRKKKVPAHAHDRPSSIYFPHETEKIFLRTGCANERFSSSEHHHVTRRTVRTPLTLTGFITARRKNQATTCHHLLSQHRKSSTLRHGFKYMIYSRDRLLHRGSIVAIPAR